MIRPPTRRSPPATVLGLALLVAACTEQPPPSFEGRRVYETFPFEPTGREWDFKADDPTISYRMVAVQADKAEIVDVATKVWQIDVYAQCFNDEGACGDIDGDMVAQDIDDTILETWKISAEFGSGVRVWQMGEAVYDPPVLLVEGRAQVDDVVTTESGGTTFTSTYTGPEACPGDYFAVEEGEERVECEKIVVTDGEADSPVAGTWWSIAPYGIVQFQRERDAGATWSIRKFSDENSN